MNRNNNFLKAISALGMASGTPVGTIAGLALNIPDLLTPKERDNSAFKTSITKAKQNAVTSASNYPSTGQGGVFRKFGGKIHSYEQGGVLPISSTGDLVVGNKHEQGGVKLKTGIGKPVEVEGGETISKLNDGKNWVGTDSLINPDTGQTFANDILDIEKEKGKYEKMLSKRPNDSKLKNMINKADRGIESLIAKQEGLKQQMEIENNPQQFELGGNLGGTIFDSLPVNTLAGLISNKQMRRPEQPLTESLVNFQKMNDDTMISDIGRAERGAMLSLQNQSSLQNLNAGIANISALSTMQRLKARAQQDTANIGIARSQSEANMGIGARNNERLNRFRDDSVMFDNQLVQNIKDSVLRDRAERRSDKNEKRDAQAKQQENMLSFLGADPRVAEQLLGGQIDPETKKMLLKMLIGG